MALYINNNVAAFNSYRNLSSTQDQLGKSLEKLSSGFRINRAADDAAGLAISEGLRSQVGGLKQAVRNAQDGISVVQTAEGALNETHSILQRMRDLAVQASNDGGLNKDAKVNIQKEITQLKGEITRIAQTTQFNGQKLLGGSYSGSFQVGANQGDQIKIDVSTGTKTVGTGAAATTVKLGLDTEGLGLDAVDVSLAESGIKPEETTKATVTTYDTNGDVDTAGTAGVYTFNKGATGEENDFTDAGAFDELSGTITLQGKTLELSSVEYADGATAAERLKAVNDALADKFGTWDHDNDDTNPEQGVVLAAATANGLTLTVKSAASAEEVATVGSSSGAQAAITDIDEAIKKVSTVRADFGAIQNRFEHTINNLNVAVENLSASESRIRDTDMAKEMVQFQRNQVLTQAGTAMLAQANQLPQGVLQLLR